MENLKDFTRTKPAFFQSELVFLPKGGSQRQRCPSLGVIPTSNSLVVPATSIAHPEWLPLTNLDRVVNPTFISVICFYENVLCSSAVVASLKESLAKVLVDFYPLAGRLALTGESGLVDLHYIDAGAIFIEASVKTGLAELGGPQAISGLSGLDSIHLDAPTALASGKVYVPDQINPSIPMLVIQATRFTCRLVALAANWHHDAFSGCHFIRSWAEVSSGKGLTLQPCCDHQFLKPLDSSTASTNHYMSKSSRQQVKVKVLHDREDSSACPGDHANSTGYDVVATFCNFFPLYQINFRWGKPVFSVRNAAPRKLLDGISIVPGPPEWLGNLVVLLNLRADHMQNLENNEQFKAAFRPLESVSILSTR